MNAHEFCCHQLLYNRILKAILTEKDQQYSLLTFEEFQFENSELK